jgi:23S rRNA (adenine-N6)-dimethyltransferase
VFPSPGRDVGSTSRHRAAASFDGALTRRGDAAPARGGDVTSSRRGDASRSRRRRLSQNFLRDRRVAEEMAARIAHSTLPVIELGAGAGALTYALVRQGHDVTAVELDAHWVRVLRRRFPGTVRVVQADLLRFRFPTSPYNVVANLPYSVTTPALRRLLREPGWQVAVLMVQWEVARKRGAGTMLSASWWPWYDIEVVHRVPAEAFRPVPRVDSGVLHLSRRADPLLPHGERPRYQRFVEAVFTGRGAGLAGILRPYLSRSALRRWFRDHDVSPAALPRDLEPAHWISLYRATRGPSDES